jgi:hypothetical protein
MARTLNWDLWLVITLAFLSLILLFFGPAFAGQPDPSEEQTQGKIQQQLPAAEPGPVDDNGLVISISGSGWRWVWNYALPSSAGLIILGIGVSYWNHFRRGPPA